MRRITTVLLAFLLVFNFQARADEGMWLLTLLQKNYEDMKKQGLKLSPEDIYNVNESSLKDAIVVFGGYCTGEIVSDQGLLLTNHHCGYGVIQQHSSMEHNYLRDGFWAKTNSDEIASPGLFVTFMESIEDVTPQFEDALSKAKNEEKRREIIEEISKKLESASENTAYSYAQVRTFFNSNQFFLVKYKKYTDVRFVGTPPESVGKFGHDTDNWVWPRHTGDFAVFRVYSAPNGSPADYSEDNIPFEPKHFLPVSIKGYKEGDFAMVLGYPGSTDRYMTSFGIEELLDITHPNRIKIRGMRQDVMKEDMKADEKVRIQYSSKFARSSNYWKYSQGQSRGLKKLDVKSKKQKVEQEFTNWVNADKKRNKEYGQALQLIENAYKGRSEYMHASQYLMECITRGIEIIGMASTAERFASDPERLKAIGENFYKDYNPPTDKKITAVMLKLYHQDVAEKYHPEFYTDIEQNFNDDFEKFTEELFEKSIFASEKKFNEFMRNFDAEKLSNDIAVQMAKAAHEKSTDLRKKSESFAEDLSIGRRLFMKGLMEMKPDKNYYPDANFTMRLTYGTVGDYSPADAVNFDYYTTTRGILEKYVPGDYEFDADPRLIKMIKNKEFGPYGSDGDLNVCFTTNNDITGGNSGSPVIDGEGNLIGLAFDGNWEAMSGDIAFETELQKCINVDIRYVLWIMDTYSGAKHLVDEMKIVK